MESGGEGGSVGGTVRSAETEESGVVKETRRVDSFRADEFASTLSRFYISMRKVQQHARTAITVHACRDCTCVRRLRNRTVR